MRIVDSKNYKKSNTDRDQSMNKRGLKIIASTNPSNPQSHPNHNPRVSEGDCWDVRQCFIRQLFGFCSTNEEKVIFRSFFCTCHW